MGRHQPLPDGIEAAGQRLLPIDFPLSFQRKNRVKEADLVDIGLVPY
ncbi:hypothetical protein [Lacrimispora sp.]|nr:hypothetical protein [Lacrimispora sp.]